MSEAIAIKNREAFIEESAPVEEEELPESQVDWKSIWKPLGIIAGVLISSGIAMISFYISSADKISPKLQFDIHSFYFNFRTGRLWPGANNKNYNREE